ncbi:MAG TPA: C13 family peptidase, partial [Allosphingosinicella sp.]|nr:C13 family peptidase [Allosphingosinicella sp.]
MRRGSARLDGFRLAWLILLPWLLILPGSGISQHIAPLPGVTPSKTVPRPAEVRLAEQRRLEAALAALKPQRPDMVDAYVVVAALHSDPVFGREAREAGRVLSRRFDAEGRTVTLVAGPDDGSVLPASPDSLATVLAKVGQLADPKQDVVVLYATSHGSPAGGLQYHDPRRGFGSVPPERLARLVEASGMPNRLVILSACYSGVFLPRLSSPTSIVITAAAPDRASFGCTPGNDWTFFGDALVNRALRKPQPLAAAFEEARSLVTGWESRVRLVNSNPQISMGAEVPRWLAPLEKRMPTKASQ